MFKKILAFISTKVKLANVIELAKEPVKVALTAALASQGIVVNADVAEATATAVFAEIEKHL